MIIQEPQLKTPNPHAFAVVQGREFNELPVDLYIPPDALKVWLETFSGPLDLLLYLIRKQNIDILDIPIAKITAQYLSYIDLMEANRLELAAEYLLMAALLAEIKSKLLLPVQQGLEEEEGDPRQILVEKLKAYEAMKLAAELIDELPRLERDHFALHVKTLDTEATKAYPEVDLASLLVAMQDLFRQQARQTSHTISREQLSVRERMAKILSLLQTGRPIPFQQLLNAQEGRMGLTVSLLAILELARQSLIIIQQVSPFSTLHIRSSNE